MSHPSSPGETNPPDSAGRDHLENHVVGRAVCDGTRDGHPERDVGALDRVLLRRLGENETRLGVMVYGGGNSAMLLRATGWEASYMFPIFLSAIASL